MGNQHFIIDKKISQKIWTWHILIKTLITQKKVSRHSTSFSSFKKTNHKIIILKLPHKIFLVR